MIISHISNIHVPVSKDINVLDVPYINNHCVDFQKLCKLYEESINLKKK